MKNEKHVKFNAFRLLCIRNAEDFINAAENLLDKNLNHIVFHLSLLGLEEIGKIFMTWIKVNQVENWDNESAKIELDDHIKKLFYSIWGASIGGEVINKNQIRENHETAINLHAKRLVYLYGAIEDTVESSRKISNEEAQNIYQFSKSRLELARIEGVVKEEVDTTENSNSKWFNDFIKLPGKENIVFGKSSQEKLIDLNDVNEWIKWLKSNYENERKELSELAENEIKKTGVENNNTLVPKWEFSFTIITPSHSIRNKDINAINKFEKPFKFFLGKNRHTLIIKYKLPSIVTVHNLWQQGWLTSKFFVAALNVASQGLFYWHANKDIDQYYDSLLDIESGKKLRVFLQPQLAVNWEEKRMYLSEQQFYLTFMVYEFFLSIEEAESMSLIMEYMTALAMFSRTDIHLRMEKNSFLLFFDVFRKLIVKYEILEEKEDVFETGLTQIIGMLNNRNEYDKNIKLAKAVLSNAKALETITLRETCAMKNYCDIYLLTTAYRVMHNQPGIRLVPDKSENAEG